MTNNHTTSKKQWLEQMVLHGLNYTVVISIPHMMVQMYIFFFIMQQLVGKLIDMHLTYISLQGCQY
jgi:hypothetical protein